MTPELFLRLAVDPALSLLPERMTSDPARAMMLAACLQESRLEHRRQIGGPARGFPQFEVIGVVGVLSHTASGPEAQRLLDALSYARSRREPGQVHAAIEHNDVLAAGFARLLLWSVPRPLPLRGDVDGAYRMYLESWRPGRPRPETWPGNYERAWEAVEPLVPGLIA